MSDAKAPAIEHAAAVRRRVQAEIEEHAAWVFSPAHVERLILEAAASGRTEVQVRQDLPVDLSDTVAYNQLAALLEKQDYVPRFEPAAQKERFHKQETGALLEYRELVISWRQPDDVVLFMQRQHDIDGEIDDD